MSSVSVFSCLLLSVAILAQAILAQGSQLCASCAQLPPDTEWRLWPSVGCASWRTCSWPMLHFSLWHPGLQVEKFRLLLCCSSLALFILVPWWLPSALRGARGAHLRDWLLVLCCSHGSLPRALRVELAPSMRCFGSAWRTSQAHWWGSSTRGF